MLNARAAMHPNDTMNGKLFAYEREDQKPLRRKLGYWRMVEERMIRAEWTGEKPPTSFEISHIIEENHKNDITYAETSRAFAAKAKAAPSNALTDEEWAFLAEHFEGANDPIAISIWTKALSHK